MASATTRATFSFHISTSFSQPSPPKFKTHLTLLPKIPPFSLSLPHKPLKPFKFIPNSIDVSKEDKPTSDQPTSAPLPPPTPALEPEPETEPELSLEEQESFDKRRLEEKFAVLNTGIFECRSCGYTYDESVGDPSYPIPPGLPFDKLPDDWRCSTCGASKSFFVSKSVEIAGFAQNQQFGLGGNTLTSGQKAILIYGTLLFFFVLFLSGTEDKGETEMKPQTLWELTV
ncbi:hypothetical protein F8388_001114 [Cannabis sativa]|uniref:Rubredoxin-like domain-containing protein n=1 Tax=Cannabis sativa TaxID=3483 RepID=A0A7J6EF67_CANSA|nr:hypothetical protein G4B88_005670 [Cannabis sativa]KAF4357032.1 hypothetical protein F8388_001114 [Cannabis sativa]